MTEIAVLLATYNGSRFLPEQLRSLLSQTLTDFFIFVRDDGSQDNTVELLSDFARRQRCRCFVIADNEVNLGACGNFSRLLKIALKHEKGFKYFAFCDQDDWWSPDKLRMMTSHFKEVELRNPELPLLVRCDLEVVDQFLQPIATSFWRYQRLDPKEHRLSQLLLRNTTVGCSMMINRELAQRVVPIPNEAMMHDWWITLVAATIGQISEVHAALVKYRQHPENSLGAKAGGLQRLLSFDHWKRRILDKEKFPTCKTLEQGDVLRKRFSSILQPADARCLGLIADLNRFSTAQRRWRVLKAGVLPRDPIRALGFLIKTR